MQEVIGSIANISRWVITGRRILDAEAFDRDSYFLTGDLGMIEADGRIRFRAGLNEIIKSSPPPRGSGC
jgi:non-ribosomal peptide synthetase component F